MSADMEWSEICRVCLQGGGDAELVSLFDTDENNEPLRDKYMYCSNIDVKSTEPLPSNICLTCTDRLLSAYQFKRQCVSSNDTLKECLTEFQNCNFSAEEETSKTAADTEVIAIKQENGDYYRYEIPIEYETATNWPTKKRNRGRPRKYPNALGHIERSPYNRKVVEPKLTNHEEDNSTKNATATIDSISKDSNNILKTAEGNESDNVLQLAIDPVDGTFVQIMKKSDDKASSKRRGKTKKAEPFELPKLGNESDKDDEEDVLLKETVLANSEPIPDDLLSSPTKEQKKPTRRVYKYDKIHTCEQCGSSFRSNASLQAHIRRHLGIKPFVCRICGYASVLNMELRRHMFRHTGVKPYKCRYCGRFFGDFGSRQKHERLHLGERPYSCTICGKSFTYSYVLSNHMLTHTGEKKFSCAPCNKKFTKAHHLKYHNKIHHKDVYYEQVLVQEQRKKKLRQITFTELSNVCGDDLLGLNQEMSLQDESLQIQQNSKSFDLIDGHNETDDLPIIQSYGNENIKIERSKIKEDDNLMD